MPVFSARSIGRLQTCAPALEVLFADVIREYDCVILCGHRNKADQEAAFVAGNTKLHFPDGNHNSLPSKAVDAAPFDPRVSGGVNWATSKVASADRAALARFYHFAGFVKGRAQALGIRIRWGGDWDGDTFFDDQTFNDLVHFELA